MTQQADMIRAQARTVADSESRTLLKPLETGPAPVSVLVSFAEVRGRTRRTGPGRSSRSQTMLTCHERTSTDLESVLGAMPREFESRILRRRMRALQSNETKGGGHGRRAAVHDRGQGKLHGWSLRRGAPPDHRPG